MNSASVQAFVIEQHGLDDWLYLLLDPTADVAPDDPLHINALRRTVGEESCTPIPRPDLDRKSWPVLVTLASPGATASTDLLRMSGRRAQDDSAGRWPYVCGWLSSSAPPEVISDHVAALGQVKSESGGRFFPMHEPLRVELLASNWESLLSGPWWPIKRWLLPASHGGHLVLCGDPEASTACSIEMIEWQQEIPLIRHMLAVWRRILQRPLTYAPGRWKGPTALPPQAGAQALAHIQQARALELKENKDILILAMQRVLLHPRLHWHPVVRSRIGQAARGQESLENLFMLFQDRDWERIVRNLIEEANL